MTRFSLAKIFAKGSYFVLGQTFDFANRTSYLPGSSGCSLQVVGIYVHMHVCSRSHAKFFTVQKKSRKKFSPTACINKIGENFVLVKISAYILIVTIITLNMLRTIIHGTGSLFN